MSIATAIVGAIGGIFVILAAVGSGYAVLRSGVAQRTIELWKAQAEALEDQVERITKERNACEDELDEVYDRLDRLEHSHDVLASIVGRAVDEEAARTIASSIRDPEPRPVRQPRPRRPG